MAAQTGTGGVMRCCPSLPGPAGAASRHQRGRAPTFHLAIDALQDVHQADAISSLVLALRMGSGSAEPQVVVGDVLGDSHIHLHGQDSDGLVARLDAKIWAPGPAHRPLGLGVTTGYHFSTNCPAGHGGGGQAHQPR